MYRKPRSDYRPRKLPPPNINWSKKDGPLLSTFSVCGSRHPQYFQDESWKPFRLSDKEGEAFDCPGRSRHGNSSTLVSYNSDPWSRSRTGFRGDNRGKLNTYLKLSSPIDSDAFSWEIDSVGVLSNLARCTRSMYTIQLPGFPGFEPYLLGKSQPIMGEQEENLRVYTYR